MPSLLFSPRSSGGLDSLAGQSRVPTRTDQHSSGSPALTWKTFFRLAREVLQPKLPLRLLLGRRRLRLLPLGSELGVVEGTYQPMKIAAAEALWNTCDSHCAFSLFQIGGGPNDQTPTQMVQ